DVLAFEGALPSTSALRARANSRLSCPVTCVRAHWRRTVVRAEDTRGKFVRPPNGCCVNRTSRAGEGQRGEPMTEPPSDIKVVSGPMEITWHPATRIAAIHYTPNAALTGQEAVAI